jgi:hypothetical protein
MGTSKRSDEVWANISVSKPLIQSDKRDSSSSKGSSDEESESSGGERRSVLLKAIKRGTFLAIKCG